MDRLVHWEIPATDVKKSAEFYGKLFGWKTQQFDPNYVMFEVEDGVGGGIARVEKIPEPCIDLYISVDDIPAALNKA
jgi:predicted enzyme related to lactoylglutathione lyase